MLGVWDALPKGRGLCGSRGEQKPRGNGGVLVGADLSFVPISVGLSMDRAVDQGGRLSETGVRRLPWAAEGELERGSFEDKGRPHDSCV